MKKADNDDNNDDNDDDTHQGWIIVRDGMYSVADKKEEKEGGEGKGGEGKGGEGEGGEGKGGEEADEDNFWWQWQSPITIQQEQQYR